LIIEAAKSPHPDLKRILMTLPFHQDPDNTLRSLIEGTKNPWNREMLRSLEVLRDQNLKKSNKKGVCSVNPDQFKIERAKQEPIHSEALCRGIQYLSQHPECSIPDFARTVLGLQTYDPFHHQAKIFNLLARMKEILSPAIKIRTKLGLIYATGAWSAVRIKRESQHAESLKSSPLWHLLRIESSDAPKSTETIPSSSTVARIVRSQFDQKFSRKEIGAYLGGSRASVLRRINELLKTKKIIRVGMGKSTHYVLKKGHEL
jgi:hypothetical protein